MSVLLFFAAMEVSAAVSNQSYNNQMVMKNIKETVLDTVSNHLYNINKKKGGDVMNYQHLEHATPKSAGVPSKLILDFLNGCEANRVELHNVIIVKDGKIIFEGHAQPYAADIPHYVHSMTKAFTNTAAGIAYSQGLLKLEDKVVSFFPEHVPEHLTEFQKEMTVKDLITMRSGMDEDINGSEFRTIKTSWIARYFKQPVVYKPGTHYFYCSGNTFMTSAIVQKVTGKTTHELINEYIVPELGMRPFTWTKSPEGICSGNSGISICAEDIVRFGLLYLNHGCWNGKQVLSREWVDRSLGLVDPVERKPEDPRYNYHWSQHISQDIYSADGFLGQFCTIVPKLNMVLAVTSATAANANIDMEDMLKKHLVDPLLAGVTVDDDWDDVLEKKGKYMNLTPNMPKLENEPVLTGYRTYLMEPNEDGISKLVFRFDREHILFGMEDARGLNWLKVGLHRFEEDYSGITGNYLHHEMQSDHEHIFAGAWWTSSEVLQMEWRFVETAFCDYVEFHFEGNTVSMHRRVNVNSKALERPRITGTISTAL